MSFVALHQAREHCRADPVDDGLLSVYIDAAEQMAQDFLNRKVFVDVIALDTAVLEEAAGEAPIVVNPAIVAAILLIVGHLYLNRESVAAGAVAELPMGAHSLLWPHRVGLGI